MLLPRRGKIFVEKHFQTKFKNPCRGSIIIPYKRYAAVNIHCRIQLELPELVISKEAFFSSPCIRSCRLCSLLLSYRSIPRWQGLLF